jgi:hypothetical protein
MRSARGAPASGVLNALTMPTLWSLRGHGDVSMRLHAEAPTAGLPLKSASGFCTCARR